jgi:predicted AAA+ superfamily ATPase
MIQRIAEKKLETLSKTFRAVAVTGPRQSGKTTLCRALFKQKPYISLENPSVLQFAMADPQGFLSQFPKGAIIDEAQRQPELFSYLQQILDQNNARGQFILTGSNNFLLQQSITQSLAGRIGYLTLLPLSFDELKMANKMQATWYGNAWRGFYPEIISRRIKPELWYESYIKTYIERDVRLLKNIGNLNLFTRFIQLCAGRAGQILNVNSIANDCGIDNKTAQSWLGVLESSYIVFFLKPFYNNYNKQVTKTPKMYFYDSGLLCHLLRLSNSTSIKQSMYKGPVFENLIVADKIKQKENLGLATEYYFWRDKTGNEIDLLEDNHKSLRIIELKSGETINPNFWKTLHYFEKIHGLPLEKQVIYGGKEEQIRSEGLTIKGWP